MMNGIAVSLVAWAINGPLRSGHGWRVNVNLRTDPFAERARPGSRAALRGRPAAHLTWLFPVAVVAAIVVWFILRRMRLGYEARAVGASAGTARAGGISIGGVQVKLFLLSGALAGLVGMQQLLGDKNLRLVRTTRRVLGFTGIAVAFLGQNNPIGIIFAAILWAILSRGETAIQIETDLPREFIIILQGILIISVVVVLPDGQAPPARGQLQRAAARSRLADAAAPGDVAARRRR